MNSASEEIHNLNAAPENEEAVQQPVVLKITVEQRDYVRGVRKWLRESGQDKERVVGGPLG